MRLSLWQQFSSNHSGFFWVVGTFKTVEDAQNAYEELRSMLQTIDLWHRQHPDESKTAAQSGNITPLPPEQDFANKYGVEWPTTIDWTNWANYYLQDHPVYAHIDAAKNAQNLINHAIRVVGRNVIVRSPDQTWMTTQPFEGIIVHLGGRTIGYDLEFIESEASKDFSFHTELTFVAPNLETANQIETAITDYLHGNLASVENPPPWNNDAENYRKVLPSSKILRQEHTDILIENWRQYYQLSAAIQNTVATNTMLLQRLALRQTLKLRRRELKFVIEDLWFYYDELGVSAFIAWLEVNGCTEIDYQYIRDFENTGDK